MSGCVPREMPVEAASGSRRRRESRWNHPMAGAEGRHLLGLHWTTPSRPAAPAIVSNPLTPHPSADVCAGADLGRGRTDELVEANLRFVFRIAGEYRDLGLPLEDLVNEGNIGLLEAARRFDSTRGTRF